MFIRKWRLKVAAGITIISMLPALALALTYSDLTPVVDIPDSPGRVLGESAYASVTLTSPTNKSLQVVVSPKYFDQSRGKKGEWLYEITWKRTLQRDGSFRVYPKNKTGNKLLAVNTKPAGSERFYAPPATSIRVNFYSQTEGRGTLLLGKYFTTLNAETDGSGGSGGSVGIANPASVYCMSNGGKLVMRSGTDGSQSGYCVFYDGQECEEWAYYNGVCTPKNPLVCPNAALSLCPDGSVPTQVPGTCNYACPTTKPCQTRPACLDSSPACKLPEPAEGWCKSSGEVSITTNDPLSLTQGKQSMVAFTASEIVYHYTLDNSASAVIPYREPAFYSFTQTGSVPGMSFSQCPPCNAGPGMACTMVCSNTQYFLTGAPSAAGSYPITITAKDQYGRTGSQSFTVSVLSSSVMPTPVVYEPLPYSGPIGTQVTLKGSGFYDHSNLISPIWSVLKFWKTGSNGQYMGLFKASADGNTLTFTIPKELEYVMGDCAGTSCASLITEPVLPGIYNIKVVNINRQRTGPDTESNTIQFNVTGSEVNCPLAYPYCPNGSTQYTNKDGCVVTVCNPGPQAPAPVIDGISGPTTLNINQTGTWTVTAHNLNNGSLSYAVDWGEYLYQSPNSSTQSAPAYNSQQTSTFTHAYSQSGKYTATFTVTNQSGVSSQSSITVIVTASSTQPPPNCNYFAAPSCPDGSKPVFNDPNSCGYTCPTPAGKQCLAIGLNCPYGQTTGSDGCPVCSSAPGGGTSYRLMCWRSSDCGSNACIGVTPSAPGYCAVY